MTAMLIKVTTTGQSRSGISAKQKPYTMATAYAHLPNVPFPQEFSYYCESAQQVLPAGEYECEVVLSIKDAVSLSRSIRARAVALLLQLQPLHGQLPDGCRRTPLHG